MIAIIPQTQINQQANTKVIKIPAINKIEISQATQILILNRQIIHLLIKDPLHIPPPQIYHQEYIHIPHHLNYHKILNKINQVLIYQINGTHLKKKMLMKVVAIT
jgi:hypothetical protein